ncbi:MAG TPA: RdgB/HAM1 family non-canonical purine NTP pyrophosphatase [Saprospiraceae bacterium]|nr:RdgB/HAM1 family non-canonical purine NTP pyrophosphatase [Saprospiraceae bacterium]
MKKEILFATHNLDKLNEVRCLMPPNYILLGLNDIAWNIEIPEPFHTYEENAKAKAYFIFDRTGISCFADDSGLEIDALNGRPGVFSARYAGEVTNSVKNIEKVLQELQDHDVRTARFQCFISYISGQEQHSIFHGAVEGNISYSPQGKGGFGYDPIFIPKGFDKTFGQLSDLIKNRISHRSIAVRKFIESL